ncbi:MAG TPA: glycoside hydrolase domain-containing protein [Gemmatimonadaceae bacterium]|nr:glycoside hydrolase domain-containing protein [Gemmatimonadaceae bacterium]
MSKLKTVCLFVLLLPMIVSYDARRTLPNPLDEIGAAVASASTSITGNLRAGRHLGFDTYAYPGDDAMLAWKQDGAPYEWVGYYLPSAPCHKGDTWTGKRQKLTDMGWGLAVIYVGQQVWSGTPRQKIVQTRYVSRRVKQVRRVDGRRVTHYVTKKIPVKVVTYARAQPGQSCSTHLVSGTRGTMDANDAIARAVSEGFADNTVIFLDIERMDRVPDAMRDYYKAWTQRVLKDGRYRPGYYTHDFNAKTIYRDVASVFVNAGRLEQPPFWIASGRGFSEDKEPHEVGHAFAQVWQGVLDVVQTHNGVKLPIDVNVASVPSPSFGEFATTE